MLRTGSAKTHDLTRYRMSHPTTDGCGVFKIAYVVTFGSAWDELGKALDWEGASGWLLGGMTSATVNAERTTLERFGCSDRLVSFYTASTAIAKRWDVSSLASFRI